MGRQYLRYLVVVSRELVRIPTLRGKVRFLLPLKVKSEVEFDKALME